MQYFSGTREEGLSVFAESQKRLQEGVLAVSMLPVDRVHGVGRQSKGHAVFMQGSRIFHQVAPLLSGDERTILVFSFQPRDVSKREACIRAKMTYIGVDALNVFLPDWVRFRCWRVYERLSQQEQRWTKQAVLQDQDAQDVVRETKSRCISLLRSLRYTDDRQYLKDAILTAIVPLQEFCEQRYGLLPHPHDKQWQLLPIVIEDRDPPVRTFTEHDSIGKITLAFIITEWFTLLSFSVQEYTQWNLCGALQDINNCIEDIFDLQQNKEIMEYF